MGFGFRISGFRFSGLGVIRSGVDSEAGVHDERADGQDEVLSGGVDAVLGRTALEDALENEHRVGDVGPGDRVVERGPGESRRCEDRAPQERVAGVLEEPDRAIAKPSVSRLKGTSRVSS